MSKRNQEIIQAAIEGFEAQKRRLNEQIAELREMLSGANSESPSPSPANGRRTMSAASRKRIAEAMRKRWVAVKKDAAPKTAVPAPKKAKRHLSPEGRRRIIEATKKRWAAVRAGAS
jgi:cell division septum initiation protein DivIVA